MEHISSDRVEVETDERGHESSIASLFSEKNGAGCRSVEAHDGFYYEKEIGRLTVRIPSKKQRGSPVSATPSALRQLEFEVFSCNRRVHRELGMRGLIDLIRV